MHDTPQGPQAEVAIGYKPYNKHWFSGGACLDTLLNPPNKHEKRVWHEKDNLIVIAP